MQTCRMCPQHLPLLFYSISLAQRFHFQALQLVCFHMYWAFMCPSRCMVGLSKILDPILFRLFHKYLTAQIYDNSSPGFSNFLY